MYRSVFGTNSHKVGTFILGKIEIGDELSHDSGIAAGTEIDRNCLIMLMENISASTPFEYICVWECDLDCLRSKCIISVYCF